MGAQTVMEDDSQLFELTAKSNNTYMALSYLNNQNNLQGVASKRNAQKTPDGKKNAIQEEEEDEYAHKQETERSDSNQLSINFKNSIYSKIRYD